MKDGSDSEDFFKDGYGSGSESISINIYSLDIYLRIIFLSWSLRHLDLLQPQLRFFNSGFGSGSEYDL